MHKRFIVFLMFLSTLFLVSCDIDDVFDNILGSPETYNNDIEDETVHISETLQNTDQFRDGALTHILEGELNGRGQAVGFHYDGLPTKKGEIIAGTETAPNEQGVFEAKVTVEGTKKVSNHGMSSFFPDDWAAQDVVDAINEAYDVRQFINGNTYEGLDTNGIVIRMYLDDQERIISAFPVY